MTSLLQAIMNKLAKYIVVAATRSGVTRGEADRPGWHPPGGWHPKEKNFVCKFTKNNGETRSDR